VTAPLRAVFVDANAPLAAVAAELLHQDGVTFMINRDPDVRPEALPALLDGASIALVDHTRLPTPIARACRGLTDVVFLGTGARSYMDPEELAALGIAVHTIRGYGDTAVAECAVALMFAAARGIAAMDRGVRAGRWQRTDGWQLRGRTLGLVGFGGIAREVARIAHGIGMRVIAWNRSPRDHLGVEFVTLARLLADSDVMSLHLALDDATRNFLSRERIAAMRPGSILVNTARGALVDEDALCEALTSGRVGHAALDVYAVEPLPAGHPFTRLPNVTLSAHSGFRTAEANRNLIGAALDHCGRIAARGRGPA
jgi:D-3-phosphoglycerate dehydrogenase / 2-oxoglutarate reductase